MAGNLVRYDSEVRNCAILAYYCYGEAKCDLPPGCRLLEVISDSSSGVSAYVYELDGCIVCAFPGSKTNWKDWGTNLLTQPLGISRQYRAAKDIAMRLIGRYGRNIKFVGHSKGGGEAAYCAISLGMKAIVFNPAWLSDNTLRGIPEDTAKNAHVEAYVFWNDLINAGQRILSTLSPIPCSVCRLTAVPT